MKSRDARHKHCCVASNNTVGPSIQQLIPGWVIWTITSNVMSKGHIYVWSILTSARHINWFCSYQCVLTYSAFSLISGSEASPARWWRACVQEYPYLATPLSREMLLCHHTVFDKPRVCVFTKINMHYLFMLMDNRDGLAYGEHE